MSATEPLRHLRASTANKRPTPAAMADGQLALNTNNTSPGLFFKDSNGALVKVGPVHVGTTAPNASPAVGGSTGNAIGEQWLDTAGGTYVFKVWDGSAWRSETGTFVDVNGDVMTGALGIIAGSAGSPGLYFSGDTNTGLFSPGADQVAISTGGSGRLFVDASGRIGVGIASPGASLHVAGAISSAPTGSGLLAGVNSNYGQAKLYGTAGGILDFGVSGADANARLLVNNSDNALQFYTNNGGSLTERLRITSAGLVGVGTSSPSATTRMSIVDSTSAGIYLLRTAQGETVIENTGSLTIRQSSGNGANQNIFFKTGTSVGTEVTAMTIDGSQRVGIGTTSPSTTTRMSIVDSTSAGIYLLRTAQGEAVIENTGPLTIRQSSGNSANQYIFFKTGASVGTEFTAMTIDGSQRVGIGTTSPGATLQVSPSSGSANFQVSRGSKGLQINQDNDSADPNINTIGATALRFLRDGGESMRIDTSGRLLVGTSSARSNYFNSTITADLQVESTNGIASIIRDTDAAGGPALILGKTRSASVGGTTIVQNGDLIGAVSFQSSDGSTFIAAASVEAYVDGTPGARDMPGRLVFSTTADGASSPTERMRITSGGDLLIGQQTNPATSRVAVQVQTGTANGINAQITSNTGTSFPWSNYNASGTYVGGITCTSTATSFPTSSDYRLKTNVQPLSGAIDLVTQLKPSTFEFTENPGETVQGFIAHELQDVVPLAVIGEKDAEDANGNPIYQGVDAAKLVPLLTAALQEAIGEIESLKARVDALESA